MKPASPCSCDPIKSTLVALRTVSRKFMPHSRVFRASIERAHPRQCCYWKTWKSGQL